ncbi:hypothetical protein [Deinococcus aestuarii]|uniref:hypothetical protein n=1 Tax=Deinococcus aestuarii TaxID=2774531 RepID=UPI001C0D0F09|nr:hypothetical protein [Deinococcus aestuarii]
MTVSLRVVPFRPDYDTSAFGNLDEHPTAYLKEAWVPRVQRDLNTGQAAVFCRRTGSLNCARL